MKVTCFIHFQHQVETFDADTDTYLVILYDKIKNTFDKSNFTPDLTVRIIFSVCTDGKVSDNTQFIHG